MSDEKNDRAVYYYGPLKGERDYLQSTTMEKVDTAVIVVGMIGTVLACGFGVGYVAIPISLAGSYGLGRVIYKKMHS